jgi:integrase
MGLGSFPEISLASARELAEEFRKVVQQGIDPIDQRRATRAEQQVVAAKIRSFDDCAREYIADHESAWRNATHRAQWSNTLNTYASPVIGKLPVSAIDTGMVMQVLKPLWSKRTETASRLRGRIESILDWARVHGYRSGENPARWKGHLDQLLPARSKIQPVKHHAALPYLELAAFLAKLRERKESAAFALEFLILTASRTSETLCATWDEIDFANKTWIVPAERMKACEIHRVPLSRSAVAILRRMEADRIGDFIFAGAKVGRPLSDMSLLLLLPRLGRDDVTVHGFRSTFRDWAAERTNFPRDVAEAALAHTESDKTEAAYKRTDFFDKRRRLMDAWAEFCSQPLVTGQVVALRG